MSRVNTAISSLFSTRRRILHFLTGPTQTRKEICLPRRKLLLLIGTWVALTALSLNFSCITAMAGHRAEQLGISQAAYESHRIIVELESPSLSIMHQQRVQAAGVAARLDVDEAFAQAYVARLRGEQSAFLDEMSQKLSGMTVSSVTDEQGNRREASYRILFNGLTVDPGPIEQEAALSLLADLPGVRAVYPDRAVSLQLYESIGQINAPTVWNNPQIGGVANAGKGVRIASIDAGVHHDAPMFSGDGFEIPLDLPPGGLGDTENNNGKIIVSRSYFRESWDPPLICDGRSWPGSCGGSHGVHTASIAAGGMVTTTIDSEVRSFSGVAPRAYVMSYKVFYESQSSVPFAYNAELLLALEDVVSDGADIVNNSWGGGPDSIGGEFDPVDKALINMSRIGIFIVMSTGNGGPGPGTTGHPSPDYINVGAGMLDADSERVKVTDFSSRGPGVGPVLKPDILAPGYEILAQGYQEGSLGLEEQHLGFGRASGTSMAAPHVSGAAALLRQLHPDWDVKSIKSALMSTAQFMQIYVEDEISINDRPAQPLDMGAGWLNIAAALDPGVILDPPSLSFGLVTTGSQKSLVYIVQNISPVTETYTLTTVFTGNGFDQLMALPGFSTKPATVTIPSGQSRQITVTFDSALGSGYGDNQGYIVMDGELHSAHLPAWARVTYVEPKADILLLDNDGSEFNASLYPSFVDVYTDALIELGHSFDIHAIDKNGPDVRTVPEAAELMAYKAIVLFTGRNGRDGFPVQLLTEAETDRLVEYLNSGGALIAMGANLARVVDSDRSNDIRVPFFYRGKLGANWIQDSVSIGNTPDSAILPTFIGPPSMDDLVISVTEADMDEIDFRYICRKGWDPQFVRYSGRPILYYAGYRQTIGCIDRELEVELVGLTAAIGREQPNLKRPGVTYIGRTLYTTFGLEGVDDQAAPISERQPVTRTKLLGTFLNWAWSEPATLEISATNPISSSQPYSFTLQLDGGENQLGKADSNALKVSSVFWDFGDGRTAFGGDALMSITHDYLFCGPYTVGAQISDWNGNVALTTKVVNVMVNCTVPLKTFFPLNTHPRK